MEIDLTGYRLGITLGRAQWLKDWLSGVLERQGVLVRDLAAVLGRLSFAAGPLERIRPFLSPIYAWTSVAPGSAYMVPPPDVLLCLRWLRNRLERGGRSEEVMEMKQHEGLLFRSDAKAEGDAVCIGGGNAEGHFH